MARREVSIKTEDGNCPASVFEPSTGAAPWPGVLMYMDGVGIRPALFDIAQQLADAGYLVLLPDLFYRIDFTPVDPKRLFSDPELRKEWSTRIMPSVTIPNMMRDTKSFLAFLSDHPKATRSRIGVTGYCLGGRLSIAAAGTFPDRIAAAASYHASGLATDDPNSPHLLAPRMQARVYVAGAIEDAGFDDAQKARLEQALSDAGVDHLVETYQARHGFVPADMPVHDEAATERHWRTLLPLFDQTLTHTAA
jgi:carboxymethylenebutenolidase